MNNSGIDISVFRFLIVLTQVFFFNFLPISALETKNNLKTK